MIIQSMIREKIGSVVTRTVGVDKATIVTARAMVLRECTLEEYLAEDPTKRHQPGYDYFYEISVD